MSALKAIENILDYVRGKDDLYANGAIRQFAEEAIAELASRSTPKHGETLEYIAEAAEDHPLFMGHEADIETMDAEGGDAAFVTDIAQRARAAIASSSVSTKSHHVPDPKSVGGLQLGVSATEQGATICLMQSHHDGSVTVIHSGTYRLGDSTAHVCLAPSPSVEPAGWQPIETAPKDQPILAICSKPSPDDYGTEQAAIFDQLSFQFRQAFPGRHVIEWAKCDPDEPAWWFMADDWHETPAWPTHWMPLPAPPKDRP